MRLFSVIGSDSRFGLQEASKPGRLAAAASRLMPGVAMTFLAIAFFATGVRAEMSVEIKVKETAGTGAEAYPVNVIVPVPKGSFKDTASFSVTDESGKTVPAQIDVLNRWWLVDESIRHLRVIFDATVGPHGESEDSGVATYYLKAGKERGRRRPGLAVKEEDGLIKVKTGPLGFVVDKKNFNIIDKAWFDADKNGKLEPSELVVDNSNQDGGKYTGRLSGDIQYDAQRRDVEVVVEEAGPRRAVIRASAFTVLEDREDHTHGFAVRIYAYAGKPYIKVEYQLQNSAKNRPRGWPLYFEDHRLNYRIGVGDSPVVRVGLSDGAVVKTKRGDGVGLRHDYDDKSKVVNLKDSSVVKESDGGDKLFTSFLDVSGNGKGVTAVTRYFWQQKPNGLSIDGDNTLSFELFPDWTARRYDGKKSDTGLHWLWDMQHIVKETVLSFHDGSVSDEDLKKFANTMQWHPVGVLPIGWYKETAVTLGLGGMVPYSEPIKSSDQVRPGYKFGKAGINVYTFGGGRRAPHSGGGHPRAASHMIATENPRDYFKAEELLYSELNLRPQWMAGYKYPGPTPKRRGMAVARNKLLLLGEANYGSGSWRRWKKSVLAKYIEGTKPKYGKGFYGARDHQHAWHYHVEDAYFLSGNKWAKDWYEFAGEFWKGTITGNHPYVYPSGNGRAAGHMICNALAAFRVTGDADIIEKSRKWFEIVSGSQNPVYGNHNNKKESASNLGYLVRGMANYLEEIEGIDPQLWAEAFNAVTGYVEWNVSYGGNFNYWHKVGEVATSGGVGAVFVDPQGWYYWNSGRKKVLDHLKDYLDGGLKVDGKQGRGPYFKKDFKKWRGGFFGQWAAAILNQEKEDAQPPAKIGKLAAKAEGGKVKVLLSAPAEAAKYHLVWSDKPIVEEPTEAEDKINWWAANAVGPGLKPRPGRKQAVTFTPDKSGTIYIAAFTFDENDNLSRMSEVVKVTLPQQN